MHYPDHYETTPQPLPVREKGVPSGDIEIRRLTYLQIPRAVSSGRDAMRNDSLTLYFKDADPNYERNEKLSSYVAYSDAIIRDKMLTIDHGDAIIMYGVPRQRKVGPVLPWLAPLLKMARTAEFTKRAHEYVAKLKAILDSNFGETIDNMFEIQALATHPAKQGRGYGTALVKVVNDMADTQARATYVVTTDAYRFYETVGYELVGEDWLGVDNPAWTGAPVPLRVMIRHPQEAEDCTEKKMRIL